MIILTEKAKKQQLEYKANEFFDHYINSIKSDIILGYRYGGEKVSLKFGYTNSEDWKAMPIFLEKLKKYLEDRFDITSTIKNKNDKLYIVELNLLVDRTNMMERLERVEDGDTKEK